MADNDWRQSLPPEYQNNERLSRFKDLGAFTKSYIDLENHMNTTGRVPRDDSKPEDWDSYYKHWGRPEKSDGYKLMDLPKEYQLDDAFKGRMFSLAHELGLNQKQFDKMIGWGLKESQGIFENNLKERDTATGELKKKWGYRFDSKAERAKRTIAQLCEFKSDNPFIKWLESTGNDTNPVILEFFDHVAEEYGEDNFVDEQTKKDASDKETAAKRIREIMADKAHPYWNDQDPRHKDAAKEMQELYESAYPEG